MLTITNTNTSFGIVAIFLHWLMAILMIGMLVLGIYMTSIPVSLWKLQLFGWHKEWGVVVLVLGIFRLIWRLANTTPTLADLVWWEKMAARFVHGLFYFYMFMLPLTGWLITSAAGLPISVFGWFVLPDLVLANKAQQLLFSEIHQWLAYTLIAIICLHTAAAFKHYFINKDAIFRRILWP